MSESWRGASSTERSHWRRVVRPNVLARDGGMCKLAYPGEWTVVVRGADGSRSFEQRRCLGVADQVHHTLGKRVTGDDMRYLVAACGPCNRKAGDPSKGKQKMREVSL